MGRQILLSPQDLRSVQQEPGCITVDCRFDLNNTGAGFTRFLEGHIPGAVYAHLDDDLSSPVSATSGRHPLPDPTSFSAFLGRCGWQPGTLLVVYDDGNGSIATRLWWLMKYFGHDCAALLDGGIAAWQAAGFELESGYVEAAEMPAVELQTNDELVYSTAEVADGLENGSIVLIDARDAERFRGEIEPIDPVAGHVPGAVNYPLTINLDGDGTFKPLEELRHGFENLCGTHTTGDLVHMCGSGVTACLNLFAAELAGLKDTKLYVGSWSEWIRIPSRPIGP